MAYTADKPDNGFDPQRLRATIPGWGVDLDPRDRPGVPMEQFQRRGAAGTGGAFPERQIEVYTRERSTEHKFLTPVFGTACPPKGLSGVIRRLAYRRYSEGQTTHWLLLLLADRIDILESATGAVARGRPDNPIAEMGLSAEVKGYRSRFGQHRADNKHLPIDILLFAGKGLLAAAAVMAIGSAIGGPPRRRT